MSNFLGRSEAAQYADWFKALADTTRVQIVSLLSNRNEPLTVGQIVEEVGVAQSTVSHHLKTLTEVGFVLVQREGAYSRYRVNEECVTAFPSAADLVMGHPAPAPGPGEELDRWGRPR